MIQIGNLHVRIPAPMGQEAHAFACGLAQELSDLRVSRRVELDLLKIGPIEVDTRRGVSVAVKTVAAKVHQAIEEASDGRRR